jgi:hypothetical protein
VNRLCAEFWEQQRYKGSKECDEQDYFRQDGIYFHCGHLLEELIALITFYLLCACSFKILKFHSFGCISGTTFVTGAEIR